MDFETIVMPFVNKLQFNLILNAIGEDNLQEFYIWTHGQNNELSWLLRGKLFSQNDEQSWWCYEQTLTINNNNKIANFLLGIHYQNLEMYELAISYYNKCTHNKAKLKIAQCYKKLENWYMAAYYSILYGENGKKIFNHCIGLMSEKEKLKLYLEIDNDNKKQLFKGFKMKMSIAKVARIIKTKRRLAAENEELRYRPPNIGGPEYEAAKEDYMKLV